MTVPVLPLTASCLSLLPGFECLPGHLRKLSVTLGHLGTPDSFITYDWLVKTAILRKK